MKARRDERFAVRLTRTERQQLEKLAVEQDRPASQVLRQALRWLLTKTEEGGR